MRLLLDSSGSLIIVALADEQSVILSERVQSGSGESRDIGAVTGRVLGELNVADLSEVVVGTGPGTFIGTRVALAFANGLAAASNTVLKGVNSLAAIAAVYGTSRSAVLRDARRGEIYCHGPLEKDPVDELVGIDGLRDWLVTNNVESIVLEEPHPGLKGSAETLDQIREIAAAVGIMSTVCDGVPAEGLRRAGGTIDASDYVEPVYLRGFL